jgi:hypothetical protein
MVGSGKGDVGMEWSGLESVEPVASEGIWNVRAGSASSPRAKFLYRMCAPLRWYRVSTLRIVALEIRAFPLRIAAALRTPSLRLGNTVFSPLWGRSMATQVEENKLLQSCIVDIQELQSRQRWIGPLDLEICAEMHRRGALSALGSRPPYMEIPNTESAHP